MGVVNWGRLFERIGKREREREREREMNGENDKEEEGGKERRRMRKKKKKGNVFIENGVGVCVEVGGHG